MSAKPELTIPVKMDGADALAMLRKIQEEMKKAGIAGQDAGKKAKDGLGGFDKIGNDVAGIAARMVTVGAAVGGVTTLWHAYAAGVEKAADNMAKMSKDFMDFRRSLTEVAGMQGQGLSNKFTAGILDRAAANKMDPGQFQEYITEAEAVVAGNVGVQVSREQADAAIDFGAKLGRARKTSAADMAAVTGQLIREQLPDENGKPRAEALENVKRGLGGAQAVGDSLIGRPGEAFGQAAKLSASGMKSRESFINIAAQAYGGGLADSAMHTEAVITGLVGYKQDTAAGKNSNELGLAEGEDTITAQRKIYRAALRDKVNMDSLESVAAWAQKHGFNDKRQWTGLAHFFQAERKGAIATAEKRFDTANAEATQKIITDFENDDEGKQRVAEANTKITEAREGISRSGWELEKEIAKEQLIREKRFTTNRHWSDSYQDVITSGQGYGTYEERITHERALKNLDKKARDLGLTSKDLPNNQGFENGHPYTKYQAAVLSEQYLKIIADAQQRKERAAANKPLVVPPPNPVHN